MASYEVNTRFDSQLSRMNCQTCSTGLSSEAGQGSGHLAGRRTMVMFAGTVSRSEVCHPVSRDNLDLFGPGES